MRLGSLKSDGANWARHRGTILGPKTGKRHWGNGCGEKKLLESTKSPNYTYSIVFERIGFLSALEEFSKKTELLRAVRKFFFAKTRREKKRGPKKIVSLNTFSASSILYLIRSKIESPLLNEFEGPIRRFIPTNFYTQGSGTPLLKTFLEFKQRVAC